ncbi:6321_t:CDS:2 [Cetraspora pellucida]|uniref:6321_t:CDS:1 n=1 Tax=Cetraspora pellucida TaxID=1433469 RepID=A0A9N9E511_9GLOM|nr:6321_t:CDS:2 [Cetraspora pellucida]
MGEFLANKISNIVERLGSDKFATVVIDAASNCNLAHQKIQTITDDLLEILLSEHSKAITNQEVANLIANEEFF